MMSPSSSWAFFYLPLMIRWIRWKLIMRGKVANKNALSCYHPVVCLKSGFLPAILSISLCGIGIK